MQESEQVIGVEIAWIGTKNFAIQPRGLRQISRLMHVESVS